MLYKLFSSLISVLVTLFFILLGIICLIFPWSEMMKSAVTEFILHNSLAISLMGFAVLAVGLARLFYISSGIKPTYYHFRTDSKAVWIDETIIQDYVDNYWRNLFPKGAVANKVTLKNNKIFLSADLPYVPSNEQKDMIQKIQKELSDLFSLILGYKNSFTLSATFQPKPKEKK